jgi:hypothetical protein
VNIRRLIALTIAIVSALSLISLSSSLPPRIDPVFANLGKPTTPFVPAGSFINSSWFCPGVPASGDGFGGSVVVANPNDTALFGRLTAFTDAPTGPIGIDIEVPPRDLLTVNLRELQPTGTFLSALVEVIGGGGFVEQVAVSPNGSAAAACSNSPSSTWYFADGFTLEGSTENLVITNPFPQDAIVDIALATRDNQREPLRLQGYPIAGQSIAVITDAELAKDELVIGISVVASRGRVVVGRAQNFPAAAGRNGFTMTLGAPALGDQYFFADGETGPGVAERYSIYNGSDREAAVRLYFFGLPFDSPFINDVEFVVDSRSVLTFNTSDPQFEGLPAGRHGIVFSSTEQAIVVERAITRPAGDLVATSVVLGAPGSAASTRWSMAVSPTEAVDAALIVLNVDTVDAVVTVKAVGAGGPVVVPGLEAITVTAGAVATIGISDPAALGKPIIVESTQRIYVERSLPRGTDSSGEELPGRSGSYALAG